MKYVSTLRSLLCSVSHSRLRGGSPFRVEGYQGKPDKELRIALHCDIPYVNGEQTYFCSISSPSQVNSKVGKKDFTTLSMINLYIDVCRQYASQTFYFTCFHVKGGRNLRRSHIQSCKFLQIRMHKFDSYFLACELVNSDMDLCKRCNSDRIRIKIGEKII